MLRGLVEFVNRYLEIKKNSDIIATTDIELMNSFSGEKGKARSRKLVKY